MISSHVTAGWIGGGGDNWALGLIVIKRDCHYYRGTPKFCCDTIHAVLLFIWDLNYFSIFTSLSPLRLLFPLPFIRLDKSYPANEDFIVTPYLNNYVQTIYQVHWSLLAVMKIAHTRLASIVHCDCKRRLEIDVFVYNFPAKKVIAGVNRLTLHHNQRWSNS